jgi:3-oxoadipate enol-lactonase
VTEALDHDPVPMRYAGYRTCTSDDGVTIYYCARGAGRTVVLVNNLMQDPALWTRCGRLLTDRYRVVTFDLRNQGMSGRGAAGRTRHAGDVLAVMDAVGAPTATLFGHSYGTQIALECALRYPERVDAAVLCGPVVHPSGALRRARILQSWREALVEGGSAGLFDLVWPLIMSDNLVSALLTGNGAPYRLLRSSFINAVDPHALVVNFDGALEDQSTALELAAVECPALLIVGEEDWMTTPGAVRELCRAISSSQLVTLGDVGHLAYVEEPHGVATAVRTFLELLDSAEGRPRSPSSAATAPGARTG